MSFGFQDAFSQPPRLHGHVNAVRSMHGIKVISKGRWVNPRGGAYGGLGASRSTRPRTAFHIEGFGRLERATAATVECLESHLKMFDGYAASVPIVVGNADDTSYGHGSVNSSSGTIKTLRYRTAQDLSDCLMDVAAGLVFNSPIPASVRLPFPEDYGWYIGTVGPLRQRISAAIATAKGATTPTTSTAKPIPWIHVGIGAAALAYLLFFR